MTFESAAKEMEKIAKNLVNSKRASEAGRIAADMIAGHIYKADGMAALSAATQAYRGRGRPLQDTGSLRDSISYEQVNNNTVSVGTNKIYAPIQNNGGTINAKKNWLFIPASGTRQLQRTYGYSPTQVLNGLKANNYVYRAGRTICYRKRGSSASGRVAYYLKKSVVIPQRRFFYLTEEELNLILTEVTDDIL